MTLSLSHYGHYYTMCKYQLYLSSHVNHIYLVLGLKSFY